MGANNSHQPTTQTANSQNPNNNTPKVDSSTNTSHYIGNINRNITNNSQFTKIQEAERFPNRITGANHLGYFKSPSQIQQGHLNQNYDSQNGTLTQFKPGMNHQHSYINSQQPEHKHHHHHHHCRRHSHNHFSNNETGFHYIEPTVNEQKQFINGQFNINEPSLNGAHLSRPKIPGATFVEPPFGQPVMTLQDHIKSQMIADSNMPLSSKVVESGLIGSNTNLGHLTPFERPLAQNFVNPGPPALEQDLVFAPPPTNLGLNKYATGPEPVPGGNPLQPHNLNPNPVIRNLVDLPNESKRNGKSVSKYRRTKNQPTNPINRETIAKLYDITPYEMTKLKKLFEIHSGVDRKLNFQEFVRLYGYMNENLRGPHIITLAERAFQFSDTNNDGLINFDEFLVSYALSKPYANLPPPSFDQEKLQAQQIPIGLQANPLGVSGVAQNLIPSRSFKIVPQYIPQLLEP